MSAPTGGPGTADVPTRPLRADAQRNRARIIAAAQVAFQSRGEDASLEEIARAAGVGIGTLYRHFPNRNALLDSVFRESVDELCAQAEARGESDDPADAFVDWLRAQLGHAMTYQSLAASLMISELGDESPVNACGEQTACAALRATAATQLARGAGRRRGARRPRSRRPHAARERDRVDVGGCSRQRRDRRPPLRVVRRRHPHVAARGGAGDPVSGPVRSHSRDERVERVVHRVSGAPVPVAVAGEHPLEAVWRRGEPFERSAQLGPRVPGRVPERVELGALG